MLLCVDLKLTLSDADDVDCVLCWFVWCWFFRVSVMSSLLPQPEILSVVITAATVAAYTMLRIYWCTSAMLLFRHDSRFVY
jgi:hypothetical protein